MPKVVITHTKNETNKDWVIISANTLHLFTEEEKVTIGQAYAEIQSMTGYLNSEMEFLEGVTFRVTNNYATLPDAENALNAFQNLSADSSIYKRNQILANKRKELGVSYKMNMSVIK
jgi:hypothetical protein